MRSSAVVSVVGALLALGAILQTTQAQEQNDKPAKLVRKGGTAVQQDARPVAPARPENEASPPVIFEEEPDQDHARDHAKEVLDEELLKVVQQLLHGEGAQDEAGAQEQSPLLRIGRHMRDAEGRIALIDAGRETQTIQTGIVKDLDALIDRLKRQAAT